MNKGRIGEYIFFLFIKELIKVIIGIENVKVN